MNKKEMLKEEEEKMKLMYGEPCHLIKGIFVALLIEGTAIALLLGAAKLIANLFMYNE